MSYSQKHVESFNKAAARHKGEFESLMTFRSLRVPGQSTNYNEISDFIKGYPDNTVLLFFDHDGDILSIWALCSGYKHKFAWEEVNISKQELGMKIQGFRNGIQSLASQIDRAPRLRAIGRKRSQANENIDQVDIQEISQLLFHGNIATVIRQAKNILIVPTLGIGTIPLGMLSLPNTNEELIDISSTILLPSLFDVDNFLIEKEIQYEDQDLQALVLGNPDFGNDSEWHLPALPGAENEAKTISNYFNTSPLIGKSATKANILKKIESSDIIYFATHGLANSSSPLDKSFLALSGNNTEESRLTAREIQNLSLGRAKLAVLSACQTGLGKVEEAGIIGLARAFTIAGVKEMVVSLWNVDDEVTAEAMGEFMRVYIEENRPASYALRISMLKIRQKYNNPKLWAPFVVFSGKGTIQE